MKMKDETLIQQTAFFDAASVIINRSYPALNPETHIEIHRKLHDYLIQLMAHVDMSPSETFSLKEVEAIEKKAVEQEKFTLNEGWKATLRQLAEAANGLKVRIDRATVKAR